ncbi:MAG: aminoglycoside phosphotransferase family protein [Alphaproteobacteria bacterium]|nr:aminoglycoside phosphotransferase family protein [Alphaproteobacteria bacterium]
MTPRKKRITEFHREVFLLRSFQDHGLDNIEVPTLIGTPEELDHQDFMARYSMTIVGGSSLPKIKPEHLSKDLYQDRYKSAGALLARFHSSTQNMDLGKPVGIDLSDTTEILPVDAMTSETNEKLRRANAYLQSNMAKGIAHGNFTITNIMGEQDAATGLIDFAHTGNAENIYADFMGVPSEYLEYAIQGYEEESGKSVRYDVYATILALHTNNFSISPLTGLI